LVTAAARAHRSLRAALLPWQRMHAAHLAALEATPADGAGVRARGAASALSARVRREETGLQRRLTDAAAAARSGPVASLLATMSAAVAQQLAASQPGRSS
ncbi:MAG TPA: cell division protein FtsK, partial [Nocardioides sp.]|nr:cell division protein FtsK [Nocardioides sp.]